MFESIKAAITPYLMYLKIGVIVLMLVLSYIMGYKVESSNFEAYKAKQANQILIVKGKQDDVTNKVEIKYIKGADHVRTVIKEVIKQVPIRVTDTCILSNGFISLHNSAAENTIPNPSSGIDAAPSGITVAEASSTIFENYGICNETSNRLTSLQEWVTKQKKAAE